ncbi:MAG: hypothetical protein MR830_10685 [Succinatimonas sp.]|nr:hypothetical protein [Succinatimonas sp.]MCI6907431.1 hypothetical protein [Succinatimonas sp.]
MFSPFTKTLSEITLDEWLADCNSRAYDVFDKKLKSYEIAVQNFCDAVLDENATYDETELLRRTASDCNNAIYEDLKISYCFNYQLDDDLQERFDSANNLYKDSVKLFFKHVKDMSIFKRTSKSKQIDEDFEKQICNFKI